jgi:hypothetical protein
MRRLEMRAQFDKLIFQFDELTSNRTAVPSTRQRVRGNEKQISADC